MVLTDVGGFGGLQRDDEDRQFIRRKLYEIKQDLLNGFDGPCWDGNRGGSFLVIIPYPVPTWRVMQILVRDLPPRLRRHNHTYSAAVQIQLRPAVTVGPVFSDITGLSGGPIVEAARLIEAPVFKWNILHRTPNLALVVSAFVDGTAIRPSIGEVGAQGFEFSSPAWMKLIDLGASSLAMGMNRSQARRWLQSIPEIGQRGPAGKHGVDAAVAQESRV